MSFFTFNQINANYNNSSFQQGNVNCFSPLSGQFSSPASVNQNQCSPNDLASVFQSKFSLNLSSNTGMVKPPLSRRSMEHY